MCEFISWIEKDNEVYFLSDEDFRDSFVKDKLKGCRDNDFISHGAIRKVYNIKGGKEKECQDFWNVEKFPKKIQDKLKNFDKNFGYTFSHYVMNDDLRYIIRWGNNKYKDKARLELKRRG